MPNTVVQTTLHGDATSRELTRLIHIISDGSEETNLVIYDNSAIIGNVAKGSLLSVKAHGLSPAGVCRLNWDQTTVFKAVSFNPMNGVDLCFEEFGGIKNPAGTGATGDLTLTTLGLAAGDEFFILITVRP